MSVDTLPPSATRRFAVPPEPVLPLTVGQYHDMIRSGALESGAPIELLEGWLVNLVDRQVEVFTGPSGPGDPPDFGTCQVFLPGDQVPVVLDGNEVGRIAVDDLLP